MAARNEAGSGQDKELTKLNQIIQVREINVYEGDGMKERG